MWGLWLQTCEAFFHSWCTQCVQEGGEECLGLCLQVRWLTPGLDRELAPAASCVSSLLRGHPGHLQTTDTRAPAGGCGTGTPKTQSSHCWNPKCVKQRRIILSIVLFVLPLACHSSSLFEILLSSEPPCFEGWACWKKANCCRRLLKANKLQRNYQRESRATSRV